MSEQRNVITPQLLASIYTGFKTIFNKTTMTYTPKWPKIATLTTSKTASEVYTWLSAFPRMREWVGDKVIKKLSVEGYRIVNKNFEETIRVPRNSIEDDQYGVFSPMVEQFSLEAARLPDDQVFAKLRDGFTELCFDEKPFFSADHIGKGKAKLSNMSNAPLSAESYGAARVAMMSQTDAEDKPLNIVPDLLVVAPGGEAAAKLILGSEYSAPGVLNPYYQTAEVMVSTELAAMPKAWFLLCTSQAIKPLIWQERKKPALTQQVDPSSDSVFQRGEYTYSVEARGGAGYGFWQLAYGSKGEGA